MGQTGAPGRFLAHGALCAGFSCLTSGVFLSGLALWMGAEDVLVSYLSVILNICGVLILALGPALEKIRSPKALAVGLTVLSRLATLTLAVIPVLVTPALRLGVFVAVVVVAFTLQAQTTVALNRWMMGFVEEGRRGRYVSLRQTITMVVNVLCALAGGWWMDRMEGQYVGFAVLFGLAGVLAAGEVALLARIPDQPCEAAERRVGGVLLPLKDAAFVPFLVFVFAFYLLLNIGDSFTMVYLMKYLALPYQTVNALYMLISVPQIFLLGLWGRVADRRGHAVVLNASVWLFVGETACLLLAGPESWAVFVPLAFLIAAVGNAGFLVAVFNRKYELMPPDSRIAYDNVYTAAVGAGCILGPVVGGLLKGNLETLPALEAAVPFGSIRLLYLCSASGIFLLQVVRIWKQKRRAA